MASVRLSDEGCQGFAFANPLRKISDNRDTCTIHRELLSDLACNVSAQIEKIISEALNRDQNERSAMLGRSADQIDGISVGSQLRTLFRNCENSDSFQFQRRTRH